MNILISESGKIFHQMFGRKADRWETSDCMSHPRKNSPISKLLLAGTEAQISPVVVDIRIKLSSEICQVAMHVSLPLSCRSEKNNSTAPKRVSWQTKCKHYVMTNSDAEQRGTHLDTKSGPTWETEIIPII